MRKVIYRAKGIDRWFYGGYAQLHLTSYCFGEEIPEKNEAHKLMFEETTDWGLPNDYYVVDVNPETVGEWTGVYDKKRSKSV